MTALQEELRRLRVEFEVHDRYLGTDTKQQVVRLRLMYGDGVAPRTLDGFGSFLVEIIRDTFSCFLF